jgi:tetratricopeptide (TPR) repeat protein
MNPSETYLHAYRPSVYISRKVKFTGEDADKAARTAIKSAMNQRPGDETSTSLGICVYGPTALGKTRLAWEAMQSEAEDWQFVSWPVDSKYWGEVVSYLQQKRPRVVIWLDELTNYANSFNYSVINTLPNLFDDLQIRFVIIATCQEENGDGVVHRNLPQLLSRLTSIRPDELTPQQGQRLVQELTKAGESVRLDDSFDGRPGIIVAGVSEMRTHGFGQLPEQAKAILKAVKLLRAAGIREYPVPRVIGTASALLELHEQNWDAAFESLKQAGFLRLQWSPQDQQFTVIAQDIYLDLAVPYYRDSHQTPENDWRILKDVLQGSNDLRALETLADAFLHAGNDAEAESSYKFLLENLSSDALPIDRAKVEYGLGSILLRRLDSFHGSGSDALADEAELHFRNVLRLVNRQDAREIWAGANQGLAGVLRRPGSSTGTKVKGQRFEEAVAAARNALQIVSRDQNPAEWAETQLDLGAVLLLQGRIEANSNARRYLLDKSIKTHEAAIGAISREGNPSLWARAQYSYGDALVARSESAQSNIRRESLRKAIAAYQESLRVPDAEQLLPNSSQVQASLGRALRALFSLATDPSRAEILVQAIEASRSAQQGYIRDNQLIERVDTDRELANMLVEYAPLADENNRVAVLTQAAEALQDALSCLGGKGPVETRDSIRVRLAQIFLQRASATGSAMNKSACEDLSHAQQVLAPVLGRAQGERERAEPYRLAKRVKREIESKSQSIGCQ